MHSYRMKVGSVMEIIAVSTSFLLSVVVSLLLAAATIRGVCHVLRPQPNAQPASNDSQWRQRS